MKDRLDETEESGPIQTNVWDTRTRENSRWCAGCRRWLSLGTFTWLQGTIEDRLKYHQKEYCKQHPDFNPTQE
jgi:hypothetical protein